ncbi:MAG: CBS domain-containing protein [Gemmatimonadales bacterium]
MPAVRDILARKGTLVVTATPEDTVLDAARLMNQRGIGAVVVMDGTSLRGIFTERDLMVRVVAERKDPSVTVVGDVMSRRLVTARAETTVEECAGLMTHHRIRHLPVLGDNGIAGVVTIGDLLAYQLAEQEMTISQLNSYLYDVR